jgi:hypothetical protein
MLMRTALSWNVHGRVRPAAALAAAVPMLASLASTSAEALRSPPSDVPVVAVADDGMPGKGLPPTPGPTNPSSPAR